MCGRFSQNLTWDQVREFLALDCDEFLIPTRYNIAPTQKATVVRYDGKTRKIDLLRWGLIPSWSRDTARGVRMINARRETLTEKPAFKEAIRRRRCLIPADGFYEWKGRKGTKQPYRIFAPTDNLIAFAGLWDAWHGAGKKNIESFTIITTASGNKMSSLHHRMPVMLESTHFDNWLAPTSGLNDVLRLLQTATDKMVDYYPVSKKLNSPLFDNSECIVPIYNSVA